jgi:hypothetical protein
VSGPAHAIGIIVPDGTEFIFSEGPGFYTITNHSTDWYIEGLAVGNPNQSIPPPTTTQSHWAASDYIIFNSPYPTIYVNVYLNNNDLLAFSDNLLNEVGPGQSSSKFFFYAALGSDPTLNLVNGSGQTTTIIPTGTLAATPLPSTWTMMLIGFVGLGFFAYRGTKKNSAALAA